MHLLIAQNILQGYGHSFIEASPDDLSKIREMAINFWPPGYCLLLIPFLLAGLKGWQAIAVSDAMAIVIFYWCWFKLIKLIYPSKHKVFTLLVFSFFTFAYTPLGMHYALGTNIWSLLCFSLALLPLSKLIGTKTTVSYGLLITYYLLLFLAVFFRYSYYPIGVVMSVSTLFLFYRTNNFKRVAISMIFPIVVYLSFVIYQSNQFGNLNYINTFHEQENEILHVENLKKTSAFVSNSFLHPIMYRSTNWFGSVNIFLINSNNFSLKQWISGVFKYAFVLSLTIFLVLSIRHAYRKFSKNHANLILFGLAVLLAQGLFLALLSLKYPAEIFRGIDSIVTWTYVEEVRYFNAINLSILVFGFYFMHQYKPKWFIVLLVFMAVFNFWSFIKTKTALSLNPEENIKKRNFWVLQTIPDSMVPPNAVVYEKELKQRKSNYHFVSVMYAEKGVPILKYRSPEQIKTSKPVTLILILDNIEKDGGDAVFKSILQKNNAFKLGHLFESNISVWGVKINPGQKLLL